MLSSFEQAAKSCIDCGQMKSIDDFYRHPKMRDGHLNKCKACVCAYVKLHRDSNREYYKAYHTRKYQRNRVAIRQRQAVYAQTDAAKASMKASRERWQAANPEKRAAHIALGNALRDGKIVKPRTCTICGASGRIHGHHRDYSQPLAVEWCCATCHAHIHQEEAA
jgi:hypothetical protein